MIISGSVHMEKGDKWDVSAVCCDMRSGKCNGDGKTENVCRIEGGTVYKNKRLQKKRRLNRVKARKAYSECH